MKYKAVVAYGRVYGPERFVGRGLIVVSREIDMMLQIVC
jgi:hypothetical protein